METFFCSPASYVPLSLRDTGRGKSSQVTTGWVMWHTEGSVKMIHEDENVRKWGEEQKEREQNRLVKHFTVKSSSDLSTQFSVCLSSDNWKVVSVCTEPQGGRKHFLAGLDRLDNGRKKRTNAVRRQQREDWRRAAVRTCVCAHGCTTLRICIHSVAWTLRLVCELVCVCVCVSFNAPSM